MAEILMVAGKKSITRKWNQADPPTLDQWVQSVKEIYTMEKLTPEKGYRRTETEEMDKMQKDQRHRRLYHNV